MPLTTTRGGRANCQAVTPPHCKVRRVGLGPVLIPTVSPSTSGSSQVAPHVAHSSGLGLWTPPSMAPSSTWPSMMWSWEKVLGCTIRDRPGKQLPLRPVTGDPHRVPPASCSSVPDQPQPPCCSQCTPIPLPKLVIFNPLPLSPGKTAEPKIKILSYYPCPSPGLKWLKHRKTRLETALLEQLSKIKFRFIVGQHRFTHTSNRPKKINSNFIDKKGKKKKTFYLWPF